MLQVEQVIGGPRHQEVKGQIERLAENFADLDTGGPTRRQHHGTRGHQRFPCALAGIVQHMHLAIPRIQHLAGLSISAGRCAVIYLKLELRLDIEQAGAPGSCHRFGPVVGGQLAEDVVDVAFHRPHGDHEPLSDFVV